ncbi:TPA: peptidase M4 [Vibrio vulnificus]|nr:peptidase M4 [Vibrio vulnificus]
MKLVPIAAAFVVATSLQVASAANDSSHTAGKSNTAQAPVLKGKAAAHFRLPDHATLIKNYPLNADGMQANRYQQRFENATVFGGEISVIVNARGETAAVIGRPYENLLSSNEVQLKAEAAKGIVMMKIGGHGKWHVELYIDPNNGRFFYIVENQRVDSRWHYWIDAETGEVLNAYDGLTTGSGTGVHGDTKDLTSLTTYNRGKFEMVSSDGRVTTYDAGGRSRLPGTLATDDDDNWVTPGRTSPGQAALVDAHFFANVTDHYFRTVLLFDWVQHYAQGMVSSAHVRNNYNNAYWNGSQMAYGDGDGVTFLNLSGDLDVVGHELSHGLTDATSDLIYQNESGALNEAFSDIMGTNIEFFYGSGNWTIGEDITPNTNGIRNMADPGEDGDPSHYNERYTGTGDNGGVHINSGIINHWYYLLVNGGQNSDEQFASGTDVSGIGLSAATQIVFSGFTTLPPNADFCLARSATDAVSGTYSSNVLAAWNEVGVTETLCSGGGSGSGGTGGDIAISNVSSRTIKGVKFQISWETDVASSTEVTFSCCGTYVKNEQVTSHSYNFNGSKGVAYEYYVTSKVYDAAGNVTSSATAGPFVHQN